MRQDSPSTGSVLRGQLKSDRRSMPPYPHQIPWSHPSSQPAIRASELHWQRPRAMRNFSDEIASLIGDPFGTKFAADRTLKTAEINMLHLVAKIERSVRLLNQAFQQALQFRRRLVAVTFGDVGLLTLRKRIQALSQFLSTIGAEHQHLAPVFGILDTVN
jgi:hypothetical protein